MKNKEKRLRLQLGAAVKLRHHPKLIVSIDEAKEAKIEGEVEEIENDCLLFVSYPPSFLFRYLTITCKKSCLFTFFEDVHKE